MSKLLIFSELNTKQIMQYREAIPDAFPIIITNSKVTKEYWPRLEKYFPEYQLFLVAENDDIIGFFNAIPVFWDNSLAKLPNDGWDWLLKKGINDFENEVKPNYLGGLQIIVTKPYQKMGYSTQLIEAGKNLIVQKGFDNLIIPIRPILKNKYPEMDMKEYINLKEDNKIFDPWIRTHLACGAHIIGICYNSMNIDGDIDFWEKIMKRKIDKSGIYIVDGALNPIHISIEDNQGEYQEENIWISYAKD